MTSGGIRCDYFKKYEREDGVKMIKNIYGEVLIAHSDGNAGPVPIFDHRTLAEQTGSLMSLFTTYFPIYLGVTRKCSNQKIWVQVPSVSKLLKRMPRGIPIVFQIKVAGSDYHMYCTEEGDRKVVKFKEGSAPKNVEDNMKNIIFYQQMFDNTYSQFESAWALGWFLCTEAANRSHILGLKKVEKNQDEMIAVGLENVQ
ncbi:interleukin-18-like isoform X2 [Chiloscyllium plagiosum]|uniref:interleukin-18-like isoform X2 n=1 Tax=Chiloscyllium plagiosum TaxID=36176 RepID=UPI001CB88943|nr:interleukin-18-like isoform X2 [Chiloscyllium plagiosum]